MSDWQKILHESIDTLDKLADEVRPRCHRRRGAQARVRQLPDADHAERPRARSRRSAIRCGSSTSRPSQELDIVDGVIDSLDEDGDSPVPNITHRYPDRVLFLVSPVCASYCRFCTRRRKVGDPEKIPLNQYESAFAVHRASIPRSATSSCRAATR